MAKPPSTIMSRMNLGNPVSKGKIREGIREETETDKRINNKISNPK